MIRLVAYPSKHPSSVFVYGAGVFGIRMTFSSVQISSSALFLYFLQVHPYLKLSFSESFFPYSFKLRLP